MSEDVGSSQRAKEWTTALFNKLDAYRAGAYKNYADFVYTNGTQAMKSYFGDNLERLVQLKAELDPNNTIKWVLCEGN